MEDPEKDIIPVILQLATTACPDLQRNTIDSYMTEDISFAHPVCSVRSGPSSRERVLKIYQWYRILSPHIDMKIDRVVYDEENSVMYIETIQWFKLFFLPVKPQPARLLTRLELRKSENLYYISRQEDFYHPSDFTKLVLPPLAPLVYLLLAFGAIFSHIGALVGQLLGFWAPVAPRDCPGMPNVNWSEFPASGDHEDLYSDE